jgi:hypothetical protein
MTSNLDITNLVIVKAPNARLGQKGRVVNRFDRTWTLYAVQFDDNCIGYLGRSELERCKTVKQGKDSNGNKYFHDVIELVTRP